MRVHYHGRLPLISVKIGVSAPFQRHCERLMDSFVQPFEVRGLIDTGATISVVSKGVIEKLRIREKGSCTASGWTGQTEELANFDVSVEMPEVLRIDAAQVCQASSWPYGDFDMLIGMDILSTVRIDWNFPQNYFDITAAS